MKQKVEDHLGLVRKIANRYAQGGRMEYDDLFQEGCIGLMRACEEYDEKRAAFSTCAYQHITFAILNALSKNNSMTVPAKVVEKAVRIRKLELTEAPIKVIAERLKITESMAKVSLDFAHFNMMSLDKKCHVDGTTIGEVIPTTTDFDFGLLVHDLKHREGLTTREQILAELLVEDYERQEIAKTVGMSYKAASMAISNMRKKLQGLKEELLYG